MAIAQATLTTTQLDALIVPDNKSYAITGIIVANTYSPNDADPELHNASFDMHFVKANPPVSEGAPYTIGTRDNRVTTIVRELVLPAGETFTFDSERFVLEDHDMISFVAQGDHDYGDNTTDLAVTISYLEV